MAIAVLNIISFILVLVGSINWGLVAIFDWNLVSAIFGATRNAGTIITYVIVLLAGLWLLFATFYQKGKLTFCTKCEPDNKQKENISNF